MPPRRAARPSVADRIAAGRAEAKVMLAETPSVALVAADATPQVIDLMVALKQSLATPPKVARPPASVPEGRERARVPAYMKLLELPPRLIQRTLGGLHVVVDSAGRRTTHAVFAHPAGQQSAERRDGEMKFVPFSASAHCRTCKSTDCLGAQYTLAILPLYLPEPTGYEETHDPMA